MKKLMPLMIVVLLIAFSCAKKEEAIMGEQGGKMVIGTMDMPTVLSPLQPSVFGSNEILDLLFLKLHRVDPKTGKMKPELASSWEFSEDLTAITYYLRTDVKWWDGVTVTAEDFVYTFDKMKDPNFNYPLSASLRFVKSAEMVSKFAIKFTFDRVYADLLTDSDIMPVPKHIFETARAGFGTKEVVGNGPYKVKEWIPGSGLSLTANTEFYRGKPPLDEILIRYYTDINAMIADFEQGNLDLVMNLTPALASRLSANQNINISSFPENTYTYIGWNLNNELLKDKEIRSALSMAINNGKILSDVFKGMGTVSLGPLPPSSWAFDESVAPVIFNLAQAKDILKKKGFEDRNHDNYIDKNGRDFTLTIITNIENPERVEILNNVSADLARLGIRVNAQGLSVSEFIGALIGRRFDGFIMGWSIGDKVDPTAYWHSDPAKGKYNFSSYNNKVIDSLIDIGMTMLNRKKAKEIWSEFQKTIYKDQPYTFLVVPNEISANYKRVKGTDDGIRLASSFTYWIPESERRVTVAAVIPPAPVVPETMPTVKPTTTTGKPSTTTGKPTTTKPPTAPVVSPEKLLEAAKKDTIAAAPLAVAPPPVAPPKASIITRPVATKKISPKYPESARSLGAMGRVTVKVVVGVDGKVKAATIFSSFGNPACEDAALVAAKKWEFNPATKDGEPFEQTITIPFDFSP